MKNTNFVLSLSLIEKLLHLRKSVAGVVTNRTLTDLQLILVEEWNAISHLRVTRLVNNLRRYQVVVAVFG